MGIAEQRRREPRYPTQTPAQVSVAGAEAAEPLDGIVRDVSRSGVKLVLPAEVEQGATVAVKMPNMVVTGEVRWCRLMDDGQYAVGVQISSVTVVGVAALASAR